MGKYISFFSMFSYNYQLTRLIFVLHSGLYRILTLLSQDLSQALLVLVEVQDPLHSVYASVSLHQKVPSSLWVLL